MNKKKVLVLYQSWSNWFENDYSRFEEWFKDKDGAYDENIDYYVLAFSNNSNIFQKEKNVKVELIKSTPQKQFLDLIKFRKKVKNIIQEFKPDYIYSPFIYLLSIVPKGKHKTIGFLIDKTSEMVKGKG